MSNLVKTISASLSNEKDADIIKYIEYKKNEGVTSSSLIKMAIRQYMKVNNNKVIGRPFQDELDKNINNSQFNLLDIADNENNDYMQKEFIENLLK